VREGGEVLAPPADDLVQVIDGRDLVAFEVVCMERGTNGTFNVTGPNPNPPQTPMTFRSMLDTCKDVSKSDATFVYADAAFLEAQGVAPWSEMPCWLPAEGEYAGFATRSIDKAIGAGLTFRPWSETVRDTYTWWDSLDEETKAKSLARGFGVPKDKEAAAVAAWKAAHPA
jgi:2'-hydroxyisoflavone reductase